MSTISELMEGKAPGSVKIKAHFWGPDEFFMPYFKNEYGSWRGLSHNTIDLAYGDDEHTWHLWSPPKKKKTLYQWAILLKRDWLISWLYAGCENELKAALDQCEFSSIEISEILAVKRLDHTAIEVDDEI